MKLKGISENLSEIEDRISLINRYLREDHSGITQHSILINTLSIVVQQQQILKHLFTILYRDPNTKSAMKIRVLRNDLDMNQLELANEIGVTRETISRWENGRFSMTKKNKKLIEDYIDQRTTKQETI